MENETKLTVLVTGFGPFTNHNINASWEAVKLLPDLFSALDKSSVNLIVQEICVAYEEVLFKVKELWEKHQPHIIIHVGVSEIAECLTIECQANSKGYIRPDIYGKYPDEKNLDHVTLKTNCNIEQICESVNQCLYKDNCKVCISSNAGRYLCEYIYYQSLSIGEPQVLFIHVPPIHKYPSEKTAKGLFEIINQIIESKKTCDKK